MRRKPAPSPPVPEFDLHGLSVREAAQGVLDLITRHQGRAHQRIRVIHGKGSFALAAEVRRVAAADPRVASAEPDPDNPGVTVLRLNGRSTRRGDAALRWKLGLDEPPERGRRGHPRR